MNTITVLLYYLYKCIRRTTSYALCFTFLVSVSGCTSIVPQQAASKDERIAFFRTKADKVLQKIDGKHGPGLVVWVEVDGKVAYNKSAGFANKIKTLPIDENTVFKLASVSKPLTATVVLQLADAGLLNIEDPATKWLSDLPSDWSNMTVKDLLTHRSGIPDYIKRIDISKVHELDGLTNLQLLERWKNDPRLNFSPGTDVEYSNSNYVLLAEIVAKVCNTSFAKCLRQRMFTPLGMNHTRTESEAAISGETLALNYAENTLTNGITLFTEGPIGISSSVSDAAKWLQAYQAGKIISKETVDLMTTPASPIPVNESLERYGMGWFLPAVNSPQGSYAHSGQQDGYRTLIRANLMKNVNYIILSNGGDLLEPERNELWYWIQQSFEKFP